MNRKRLIIILLLVTIAISLPIICILFGLGVVGVSKAQSSSRDLVRRDTLLEVSSMVNNYYSEVGDYPTNLILLENMITYELVPGTNDRVAIPYVQLKLAAKGGNKTTTESSAYCYKRISNAQYKLGVKLENGTWYDLGYVSCTDEDRLPLDIAR